MTVFVEAHQFKGVHADPALVAAANRPGMDPQMAAKLRAIPAFTHEVSMKFSNGKEFAIQEDDGGQYLVLDPERGSRPRVSVGEWICLLPSGRYIKLMDEDYRAMGGTADE